MTTIAPLRTRVSFLELEITTRCPLTCPALCYSESGPTGTEGSMTTADWREVITEAAAFGVDRVQLIGGEPTTHPSFPELLEYAVGAGLKVEVFTNLYRIRDAWWDLFALPGVSLATSYYSDQPAQHDRVTGRAGSHTKTRANIVEALGRGLPIRAGIIEVYDGQRVEEARAELTALGVRRVRVDRVRGVGRGARSAAVPDVSELCGRCGEGRAAISANGDVRPCVLGRFLPAGNVRDGGLASVLDGEAWHRVLAAIHRDRAVTACNPDGDGDDCAPAETEACGPAYDDD